MGWKMNPYIKDYLPGLFGMQPEKSKGERFSNKFIKRFNKGEISQYLQPEIARGAQRRDNITRGYGMGSAALIAAAGGPQASIYQSLKDRAMSEADRQTGFESVDKIDRMLGHAVDTSVRGAEGRNQFNLSKYGIGLNAIGQNSRYEQSPWWGLAQSAIGAAGAVGAAAI